MTPLPLTGERTAPGHPRENYWFARHEVVYRWLGARVTDQERWLDAGSGEGYGTALLADAGASSVGVELDSLTAAHAAATYPGVAFVRANLVALPFADDSFDAVASLQVIEHLWDVAGYLRELVRVCRPGGAVFVSTPNRATFSPGLGRGERPTNPFHVEEFDAAQLTALLRAHGLVDVDVIGVHHADRLAAWESVHGSVVRAQVDAVVAGEWPSALDGLVASVTVDDFRLTDAVDAAHDLVAIGRGT